MKFKTLFKTFALALCCLAVPLAIVTTGCHTPPQRTAYNSIFSVEQTASAAVDGYYAAVIHGQARTNEVPKVSAAFNDLQAACTLAASVDRAGTNAIAPAALTTELLQLTSLIATLIAK